MYEIRPETIKTFITDRNVKLPRFQRKQTWDEKKNFQLCISLFKEYPIGVCILSVDESKGKTVRWLLDGRQRKNALQSMYDDPENIYYWAKKFIGFKNSDQPNEIDEKFWSRINEYIEADDEEVSTDSEVDDNSEPLSSDEEETTFSPEVYGLPFLLDIIKIVHNKQAKNTGFTKPFDFNGIVSRLPYVESGNKLNSRKVKTFIDEYRKYCDDNQCDYEKQDSFGKYVISRCTVNDETKFKKQIKDTWNSIMERILIVDKIDSMLANSKIGMIEVKNLNPSDSQKIFNIINSKRKKLTSVEILSAKPHWNVKIDYPSQEARVAIEELYQKIGTVQEDTVRWDLPATLVRRIGKNMVLKEFADTKTDFEKELTIGFKICAAQFVNGIKKESIEKLGKKSDIKWEEDVERFIIELKRMLKLISSFSYFKFFNTWNTSMMELTSEAVAVDFISVVYKDWERKGKPEYDSKAKQFQKNCFILWDKLIYEYLKKQWRGAADQKTADNLNNLPSEPDMFVPITKEKWMELLNQIFTESAIENIGISMALMKPVLYHMYCMSNISAPDTQYAIDVDHIIPQTLFMQSSIANKDVIKDNPLNLALLPKDENISKSNKRLIEITNPWLKKQIEKYEFIPEEKFAEFSSVTSYEKLFEYRKKYFIDAYTTGRDSLLNE